MSSETSQDDRITASKKFNSLQSDKAEKKNSFCKRVRACFRYISLGGYRTPLYFANNDSYKSATSGILTILSWLVLAVIFIIIFVPIFKLQMYNSEIKQIKIRGEYTNGTVESCTSCRNLTVREAIEYTFNGNQDLLIFSPDRISMTNCEKYLAVIAIEGLDKLFF
jgi:hypothetical protein